MTDSGLLITLSKYKLEKRFSDKVKSYSLDFIKIQKIMVKNR